MYSMITQTKQTKKNTNVVNKVKEQIHCYDFLLENTSTHFINSNLPNLAQHYYNLVSKAFLGPGQVSDGSFFQK